MTHRIATIFAAVLLLATIAVATKPPASTLTPSWFLERAQITNGTAMVHCLNGQLGVTKGMTPARISIVEADRMLIGFGAERLSKMHAGDVDSLRKSISFCTRMIVGNESKEGAALADPATVDAMIRKMFQIRAGQTKDDPEWMLVGDAIKPAS